MIISGCIWSDQRFPVPINLSLTLMAREHGIGTWQEVE